MANDSTQWLYKQLKAKGYNVGKDEEEFDTLMRTNGESRKWAYDTATKSGLNVGKDFEHFSSLVGAKEDANDDGMTMDTGNNISNPVEAVKEEQGWQPDERRKAVDLASVRSSANQFDKQVEAGKERINNAVEYNKRGGGILNRKPVETGVNLDSEGNLERSFITPTGEVTGDKAIAEKATRDYFDYVDNMTVSGRLRNAHRERKRLEDMMKRRVDELDAEKQKHPLSTFLGAMADAGVGQPAVGNGNGMTDYRMDEQYRQLESALRKNRLAIQTLSDKNTGKMDGFWHSLGSTMINGYTFSDGLSDMNDAIALMDAKKHIKEINRKQAAGEELTKEEAAAEAVLRNAQLNDEVQGEYGGEYGAWARAGAMFSTSLDLMKDIMLTPGAGTVAKGIASGVSKGLGKAVGKVAGEKVAENLASRVLTKATGMLIGAHTAGAVVSNTGGLGHTVGEIGKELTGRIEKDENGYSFVDDKGLLEAVASAERNQIRENGSEMFGEFIPGMGGVVKSGLEKIGLSKVSNYLTKIGKTDWYKQYSGMLEAGGYNGLPGEALEEYEGYLFDVLTGHGKEALNELGDLNTHIDIWLGCATTGALLGSMPMVMHGGHTAMYYKCKHGVGKSDKAAEALIGDKWADIRDKIDGTPNESMADVLTDMIQAENLGDREKSAVIAYAGNLSKMRGYNIAQMSVEEEKKEKGEAEDGNGVAAVVNDSYTDGYSAVEPQEQHDAKRVYEMERARVESALSEEWVKALDEDPIGALQELSDKTDAGTRDVALDYVGAKQVYDGMVQRVRDDIDSRIAESDARVDSEVNRETGMIHLATIEDVELKEGRAVYIVGGNAVMREDGSGVDKEKSSESLIIRDAETGKIEFVDPSQVKSVSAALDSEDVKAEARERIREELAEKAANNIDGVVAPAEGDAYQVLSDDGEIAEVSVLGQSVDESGAPIEGAVDVQTSDGAIQSMEVAQLQQMVDAANAKRVAQFADERESARAAEKEVESPAAQAVEATEEAQSEPDVESALSRVPVDEKGKPKFEAVDSETAWDALVEKTNDEEMATRYAEQKVQSYKKELERAKKVKPKEIDDIDDFIASESERKKAIDDAESVLNHWESVLKTKQNREREAAALREAEERKAAEEAQVRAEQEKAEREEAERKEREALTGIPDWSKDTPQDARARGYRRNGPEKVDRPENVQAIEGKEVEVKFGDKELPKGRVAIIDAEQLEPSHIQGGRNPRHFLDEAQPKERDDAASILSAERIARNIRPEEITSSVTVYTGAPTVNMRGETIQGNSRSDALRLMYKIAPEQSAKYKEYLMAHAEEFGLTPEQIASVERPVLVNMLDVNDDEAIRLGQFVAQDTESGGVERIKPKNAVQRMGKQIRGFANILLSGQDEEMTLSQLIESNGVEVLKWMSRNGFISDTQYGSAFDSKGNLSAKASEDLRGILYQSIFTGGSTRLEEMFNKLPAKAQRGILATAFRDYDSDRDNRVKEELQQSIIGYNDLMAYDEFAKATNMKEAQSAVEMWKHQYAMDDVSGESYLPAEKFSNFALQMAAIYKGGKQRFIQQIYNDLYDAIQGAGQDTLFEVADKTPHSLSEAIEKVLGIEYKPVNNKENGRNGSEAMVVDNSQGEGGQQGRAGILGDGERVASISESADSGRGVEGDSRGDDEVKTQPNAFRYFAGSITDLIKHAKESENIFVKKVVAPISDKLQKDLVEKGVIVSSDFNHVIDNNAIRHVLKRHGNDSEAKRGQIPLVEADIERIEEVVKYYDDISVESGKRNDINIIYSKTYDDGTTIFVEEKRDKHKELAAVTMWKKKNLTLTDANHKVTPISDLNEVSGGKDNANLENNQIDAKKRLAENIIAAEADVNTEPTEKQKEAGNYKKGHVHVGTFDVTIENPKGSVRRGTDANGKQWETTMTHTYGYIRGTKGVDGDHIDVYLSSEIDDWNGRKAFVVDQYNPDGTFDEHKVMLGFNDRDEAYNAYLSNYEKDWDKVRRLEISTTNIEDFEKWIDSSKRKTKPFADYRSVKGSINAEGFGDFGPIFTQFKGDTQGAIKVLSELESGEAIGALYHKDIGYIDLVWGNAGTSKSDGWGLAKLLRFHPEVVGNLQEILDDMHITTRSENRINLESVTHKAAVRLTWNKEKKKWLLTAFEKKETPEPTDKRTGTDDNPKDLRGDTAFSQNSDVSADKGNALSDNKQAKTGKSLKNDGVKGRKEEVKNPSGNKLVSDERYAELRERMRKKLGGQMNMGIDPEILAIGTEMAVYHIEKGARKFADYASGMIADLGDAIRPYLKSFYNAVRDMPEVEAAGYIKDMDSYDDVSRVDIANFDQVEKAPKKQTKQDGATNGGLFGDLEEDVAPELSVPKSRPKSELAGNSEKYQKREEQSVQLAEEIGGVIENRVSMSQLDAESMKPLTMSDVKKMSRKYSELGDISDTDLQELVELAMTQITRKEAIKGVGGTAEQQRAAYDRIVSMYQIQPSLNARDSERTIKQQYSTPTPFGYVMGQFVRAGGRDVRSMLEPSAGNGALTITVAPQSVHVNDIDDARLSNLRKLGYGKVTAQDALLPFSSEPVDVVMTNPPFGTVTEKVYDGIFHISSLEGQMAINALEKMKDNGRAAIIIGGNTNYRTNGSMNPKDAAFFGYLYSRYNVADVINISGKALYSRNGTGYDVRMILIDGRKGGEFKRVYPPVKSKARAEQITTFDELYKRVQNDIHQIQQMGHQLADEQRESGRSIDGGTSAPLREGGNREDNRAREQSGAASDAIGGTQRSDIGESTSRDDSGITSRVDNGDRGDARSTDNVSQSESQPSRSSGSGSVPNDGGRIGIDRRGTVASRADRVSERLEVKPELTAEKVPYPNQSENGFTLMSVVPAAQAQALQRSLGVIGDVDEYLVKELGYSSKDELYQYLAAEQIDSVALAIHQMNKGNAFIIGDMTGVGKGRQGAALIRYAVKHGRCPIYFTQKPTLFTDNYRDLSDIGSGDLKPFIIASNPKDANIVDVSGEVVHKVPSKKEQERVFNYIMHNGKLPKEYDYVLTTYDQIKNGTADYTQNEDGTWNTEARKLSKKSNGYTAADHNGQARRDALARLAMGTAPGKGNIAILDESHTVGGDSGCGRYMQMLTSNAGGVTFLSATFAKRADNMPIYAQRTAIAEAGVKAEDLIEAISKGGVTLQEIMSKQLVESGQMIRRERSFEGVTIDWLSVAEETDRKQREQFNEVAEIFNAIRNFQNDFVKPIIDEMNESAAEQGGTVGITQGTKDLGVKNTPFASKMYNLVNQLLFALKVDAVADRVIENLRKGFKPVISFTNTMEGFLSSAPKGEAMEEVPNFSLTLMRALDGVMRYTEKDADENSDGGVIPINKLSEAGKDAYNAIRAKIMSMSADLPISPMDAIRMKIEDAGYSVAEITGRTMQMNRTDDGKYIVEARKDRDKKAAMRDFNSGELDVLMINKSGSTGISLHASSKFADQRQRVMVFAQFQSDINDEVQMRGRIDRSGQVARGRYEYIMSTIPAEQRIQMMFKAKLKSLDANTTSSQKSKFNEMEIVDYLNKYGDEVVWEYMKEHPELEDRLGDPLKMLKESNPEDSPRVSEKEDTSEKNGCSGKISRYLAFLSVEEQDEIFREITEAYRVKMQLLDDAGENDLEITTMPLRAETKRKQIWNAGVNPGSGNAFADNTYVEEVDVDVLKKPMKKVEVEAAMRKMVGEEYVDKSGVLDWQRYSEAKSAEIEQFYTEKAKDAVAKLVEAGEGRIAKAREKAERDAKKARGRGENNFTDSDIQSLADAVANEALDKERYKQQKRQEEIMAVCSKIRTLLNRLRAGQAYVVPTDLKQATAEMFAQTYGVFVGFKFNKGFTLGSSTAVFATLDGRRKVELALSDSALNTILSTTEIAHRYSPKDIGAITLDNWDSKVPTQTRQKRYIVTGNLLQALVDTGKGEKTHGNLISYSTIDGETRQGILMGENFKISDLRNSVPLSARLAQIQRGDAVVSENGDVKISQVLYGWQNRGDFELSVPKSKQRGGVYYTSPELLKLVRGRNFNSKGNSMVGYISADNLAEAVDVLSRAPFNITVLQESKLSEDDADVRYRDDEWTLGRVPVLEVRSDEDIKAEDFGEDRDAFLDLLKDEGCHGIYYKEKKKIYIFANKIPSPQDAVDVLTHESGHAIYDSLGDEARALAERVADILPEKVKSLQPILASIREEYSDDEVNEEFLVYMIEEYMTKPHARKAFAKYLSKEDNEYIERNFVDELRRRESAAEEAVSVYDTILSGDSATRGFGVFERGGGRVHRGGEEGNSRDTSAPTTETREKSSGKSEESERLDREGEGDYSNAEVSLANDPWSKVWGESFRTKQQQKKFAERERARMRKRVEELSEKFGLDIDLVESGNEFTGRKRNAKGWFNTGTKKITIVLGNHKSVRDIEATVLHEAVAHHGLRELFGEKFDEFLDVVYELADNDVKERISLLASRNGWNNRVATEEYLASLAEETEFENANAGWWGKIKGVFLRFLRNCGFGVNMDLSDNELRYVLWMSYKNLQEPGMFRSYLGQAERVAKEDALKVGMYAEADAKQSEAAEADNRFRDAEITPRDRATVAEYYEKALKSGSWQFKEAMQDSMLGLKTLYQAILGKNARIEDVPGYENAYLYENRMSSGNNGEQHQYFMEYMRPLLKEIYNICGNKELERRMLTDYMMAKHGLERNKYMREQAEANGEDENRDFAGLCGLTGESDWEAAEEAAQEIVDAYEAEHNTTELWRLVKTATNASLEKLYTSGIIGRDAYEEIKKMYDYYIPLRGWDETTSEEVYGYLTSNAGPLRGNVFKKAEGRSSKADDPIATIAKMADDAIRQGNRNIMKQRFLNFVQGNPSDLVSVSDLWLQYNDVTDEWEPVFAELEDGMTQAEIAEALRAFDGKMIENSEAEPDKYKRGKDARNIPYRVLSGNINEHQVLVKRDGRTYVITINGNPRAAQALNGLTNPNVDTGGVVGNMLKVGEYVNRQLSAFYTTRNPDFVISNFVRDMLYSNFMTWVKENPRYAMRFHRNLGKVNPLKMRKLTALWESGDLNGSDYTERMFKEFMLNGGETGYTSVRDIEGYKRSVSRELNLQGSAGKKAWRALGMQLDIMNRSVENCARFAAFLTSREMGRSLERSIYDAKEVSVNFNKKGSGGKFVNATGQKGLGVAGSYISGGGRIAFVFWNAGVQGMTNFGRAAKRNPIKALGGAATLFTLGYVIPMLSQIAGGGSGDDDDRNAYYNLPEYVRRSNICFRSGERWITIPLPIEYRAFYGLGELACGVITGNERYSDEELGYQMGAQVSQILPLDVLEGGGGVSPFIPSAIKPITEAYVMNKGWTGLPIYKDTPYNKQEPEWTKAYANADQHLVGFAKWLNETTGGDDYQKGKIDINPAKIEYVLTGTFGGVASMIEKFKKTGETMLGYRDFEWRNIPIANRLVKTGDERTENRKLREEYYKYQNEYEETKRLSKKYEKAANGGLLEYAEKMDFLYNSKEYLRYEIFEAYKKDIDAYYQLLKETSDKAERKELEKELYAVMRELVDELHKAA